MMAYTFIMNKKILTLLTLGSFFLPVVQAQTDLPVTQVVLFSNGVGYFEHSGQILNDSNVRLSFKVSEINDVLKSLLLKDEGGGTVDVVRYPSQDPLSRALQSFSINLDGVQEIETLFQRLRGTEVTINAPNAITGRLIGVERRPSIQTTGTSSVQVDEIFLNLWTASGIQSFPLRSISGVLPTDPGLREEFQKALTLIAESRNTEKKIMDLSFRGTGNRRVRVGYISEAPVWKTTYRLDLTNRDPFLQAWAIVENVTEQDWRGVRLSLVSGQPISFIQDLYTPLYNPRPVVGPMVSQNLRPQTHAQGMVRDRLEEDAGETLSSRRSAPSPAPMVSGPGYAQNSPEAISPSESAVAVTAQGARAGELYKFTVATPVNIGRRQSALIPLYNGKIEGEKISLYNQTVFATHPMNGALLTNSSGSDLPPGPITVLDGGIYAGDALLESTPQRQKRIITYGVDLQVPAQVTNSSTSETVSIRILRGVLTFRRKVRYTTEYRFTSSATLPKTVLVEHPLRSERALIEPPTFEEKTNALYRFRMTVPPAGTNTLKVVEEQITGESITIMNVGHAQLLSYSTNTTMSAQIRRSLQKAAELKLAVETLSSEIQTLVREKSQIENGQARIRDNIETVGRDSAQGQRYLQKLMEDENRIEALARQITEKTGQQTRAQRELEDFLKDMTVE